MPEIGVLPVLVLEIASNKRASRFCQIAVSSMNGNDPQAQSQSPAIWQSTSRFRSILSIWSMSRSRGVKDTSADFALRSHCAARQEVH
jgi:hypothetical protein